MSEKLTAARAAEILDPDRKERFNSYQTVEEACRMGRDALRKQVPMEAVKRGEQLFCPVCDFSVFPDDSYCSKCGQAVKSEVGNEG